METSLQAMNSVWHPNCFLCSHCRKPIGITIGFHVENGLPYCPEDYTELFSTKCDACSKAIQAGDRWIEACKKTFHAECFNCSRCGINLDGKPVVQHEGKAFCKAHGGSFGRFGGISGFWYTNISSLSTLPYYENFRLLISAASFSLHFWIPLFQHLSGKFAEFTKFNQVLRF